ncbi:MAG TPA: YciI family protein [Gemmatimonadales bacterium]|nr:YciI family protein [Gemmatimonadales bacterium]
MKFLSVIRGPELPGPPPQALMDAMGPFIQQSLADGSLVSTGGLASSGKGARIRSALGKVTVTDGPFAEAKEVIGGYAIIEAATREQAIESTVRFMQLHADHWPEWQGECEIRAIDFLAP